MSEDQHSGAEGLFRRGRDAAVSAVTTKATAVAGAIGTKALLGGLALMKGAAVLAGKGALIAVKAIILKLGLVVTISTGGIALLGVFIGLIVFGGATGASGRETSYRQASVQTLEAVARTAPANTKWFPGVSLDPYAVPWGLLEAIDMFDGPSNLDEHAMAQLLAPIARFEATNETSKTVIPATDEEEEQIITIVTPIHLLKHVSAWNGGYTFIYANNTAPDGSTQYTLTKIDFIPSWDRLDSILATHFKNTIDATGRDVLVSMGISATYGEPDDISVLPRQGFPVGAPVIVGEFAFPVAGRWRVTSPFGAFRGAGIWHRGLDLGSPMGTPLVAVTGGTVRTLNSPRGGLIVFIDADNGMRFLYAHLSRFAVRDGARVNRGDVVGYIGNTGFSTGPHLHIEFIMPDGTRIDPAPHLIR